MKKIIISLFFAGSSYALMAQEDTIVSMTSNSNNPAYLAPSDLTLSFRNTYPDVTTVTWQPMNNWWIASYNRNNRLMHTYYAVNGLSFNVALPSLSGMVPETVITSALSVYGNNLYDITRMKEIGSMEIYQVRLLDNGAFRTIYLDESGKQITDIHALQLNSMSNRPPDVQMQTEKKVKYDDGTKIKLEDNKTKIKNKDQ